MKFDINNPNFINSSKEALEFLDSITKNKKNSQWQSLSSDVKNNIVNKIMQRNKAIGDKTLVDEIAKIILTDKGKIKKNVNKIYGGSTDEFNNRQATIKRNYFGNKRDITNKKMHDDNLYLESLADEILLKDKYDQLGKYSSLINFDEIYRDYDTMINFGKNSPKVDPLIQDVEKLITKQDPYKQWSKDNSEDNINILINEIIRKANTSKDVNVDKLLDSKPKSNLKLVKNKSNIINRTDNEELNGDVIDDLFNRMTIRDRNYYSNLNYPEEINTLIYDILTNKVKLDNPKVISNLDNLKRGYNYLDEDVNLSNYKDILDEIRGDRPFDDANYLLDIEEPIGKFTKFTSNNELSNNKSKFMQQLLEYLENN